MRSRTIAGSVAVITGAGSGIGRATAILLRRRGAYVVLAGRSRETLVETARLCQGGANSTVIRVTDVRDQSDVRGLAEFADSMFGRIDTWINNAGVAAYGKFDEVPQEIYEGVLRTNLYGYMNGVRAVLPIMQRQRNGVIINNLSIVGKIGVPKFSAYAVSKAALFMFSRCLRQELQGSGVNVCDVIIPTVDTGVYQRCANYTGNAARPFPPVYTPERIAEAILELARNPRDEINVGTANYLMRFGFVFTPQVFDWLAPILMEFGAFRKNRRIKSTPGNVLRSRTDHSGTRGGWLAHDRRTALATPTVLCAIPLAIAIGKGLKRAA